MKGESVASPPTLSESEYIRRKKVIKSQVDPLISAKNKIAAEGVSFKREAVLFTIENPSVCKCTELLN